MSVEGSAAVTPLPADDDYFPSDPQEQTQRQLKSFTDPFGRRRRHGCTKQRAHAERTSITQGASVQRTNAAGAAQVYALVRDVHTRAVGVRDVVQQTVQGARRRVHPNEDKARHCLFDFAKPMEDITETE